MSNGPANRSPGGAGAGELVLGIDVGGTKIAAGCVDTATIAIDYRETIATPRESTDGDLLSMIVALARTITANAWSDGREVARIGVGVPELVSLDGRLVSNHVVTCTGEEIKAALANIAPVSIFSDVQAAAVAEAAYGAGAGARICLYVGIGTGISHTFTIDGAPYRGSSGNAILFGCSELDWTCTKCGAVTESVLEHDASGPALVAQFNAAAGRADNAEQVIAQAESGNRMALDIVKRAGERAGQAIGHLVNVLDPHVVVIGGGLGSHAGGAWWQSLESAARRVAWAPSMKGTPIVPAAFGDMTGVVGAAISATGQAPVA